MLENQAHSLRHGRYDSMRLTFLLVGTNYGFLCTVWEGIHEGVVIYIYVLNEDDASQSFVLYYTCW